MKLSIHANFDYYIGFHLGENQIQPRFLFSSLSISKYH